jgi:predicted DNA-binding protein YlxM (UPF0122 family)
LHIDPEKLREMYLEQHMTVPSIARVLGFSTGTIQNRLTEYGIRLDRPHNDLGLPLEEIRQMYVEDNTPMKTIAKHFKCSVSAIQERIDLGGFSKPRTQIQKKYQRFKVTKDELIDLYLTQNKSDMQISREFDVSNITVANWRRAYGIRRDHQPNYVDLASDELKRLYIDEKWTMGQIAEHFGCGESTVRAHIIRDGLAIDAPMVAIRRIESNREKYTYRRMCQGYRTIKVEGHPAARKDGYVAEHRYVAETVIGRYLTPDEQVHHINMDKLDNRIENLAVVANKEDHAKLHKYLERIGVYLSGLSTVRPEPLVFSTQTFWGGQYVTGIDLTSNLSLLSAPHAKEPEGVAVRNGEGTDSLIVN